MSRPRLRGGSTAVIPLASRGMEDPQPGAWETPSPRPRAGVLGVLGLLGLGGLAVVAAAAVLLAGGDGGEPELPVEETTEPPEAVALGSVEPLPAGPLSARSDAVHAWTGEELIVWGGLELEPVSDDRAVRRVTELLGDDGAAFSPATGEWRELPPAPIEPRLHPATAWAGDRLFVWGGAGEGFRPVDDGAVYLPDQDRWETLPPAPLDGRMPWTGVWSGEEFLVVGASVTGGGADEPAELVGGAAFDPSSGTWRSLPPPPVRFESFPAATWLGERLVVWRGSRGAVYDPDRDRWETAELPEPARAPGPTFVAALDDTRLAILGVRPVGDRNASGAVYDLAADAVEPIAPGAPTWLGNVRFVAAGDYVLLLPDGFTHDRRPRPGGLAWDGRARWWPLPDLVGDRSGYTSAWTGEELLIWGGFDGSSAHDDGVRWRPTAP